MTDNPLVSILIPAYNADKWIAQAIESALSQTWQNIEIIIVNDGSSDSTLEIAKQFESRNITVINQENKGAAAARNTAFAASKGQYIQYLDADDLLDPEKIAIQLKSILRDGNDYLYSSEWGMFFNDSPNENSITQNKLYQDFYLPVDWLITAWTDKVWMQPTAWLTPRPLIEKAGLWNKDLSLHDDGEFFCRVILQSKGIRFCKNAKSYYRKGIASSLSSIVSEKAITSHLLICDLYSKHLLEIERSDRTKNACAANYQNFIYNYYPDFPDFLEIAEAKGKQLGGSDAKISGSRLFILFTRLIGWKNAKHIQIYFRKFKSLLYS